MMIFRFRVTLSVLFAGSRDRMEKLNNLISYPLFQQQSHLQEGEPKGVCHGEDASTLDDEDASNFDYEDLLELWQKLRPLEGCSTGKDLVSSEQPKNRV
ncbi:hypothetical protein Leryth_018933 [Lithospermum erythrorhizon]|nr:hypothetical protein Leryth_018933 [Lithospermum erythrorhizon]